MTAMLSLLFSSCVEEAHVPGELDSDNCYGVYFPAQSGLGDLQIEPDDPTTLSFVVRRTNTRGKIFVPVKVEANHPVFTVDEIIFEDGSPVSELVLHFPSAKIATKYECSVMLEGSEYVSKYSENPSHISFSVTRVKWNDVVGPSGETTGKWRDGIFPEWFAVENPNLEKNVTIQERDDMPGYYRIYNVYDANYLGDMFASNVSSLCVSKHYTYIDARDPEKVWIPTFKTGVIMHSDYGMMSIASYVAENSDDFDPSIASVYGKLSEGVITFPYGSLQMKLELMGWYQTNSSGLHRIILPGYTAKDYGVELTAGVSDQYGNLPVNVTLGTDIATVKLAVFESALPDSEVLRIAQDLADDKDVESLKDVITVDRSKSVSYLFDETGVYTVIAAAFDAAGNLKTQQAKSFGYLKAGDDSNKVILSSGLICSDKYAADGLTSKNSLEIYISGKDIQRLHAGLYEKEEWDEAKDEIIEEIKESQMTKASLDQINNSGLFLKQGYLVPGTEYVLVVIAYNGYREELFERNATTEGPWDARLASYDMSDVDANLIPANKDGYYGTYHYYAVEGDMYSRAYLGDVTVGGAFPSDYKPSLDGYDFVNIKGLFPKARDFGLEDDSFGFIYYQNMLYSYEQAFESFYSEGTLFYPGAYAYTQSGGAYGAQLALAGAFVQDGYLALVDSGYFAQIDEVVDGFAVLAFQDSNHSIYSGLIDLVSNILLVRADLDPDPIIDERKEAEKKEDEASKSAVISLDKIFKQGPVNNVESFDGYIISSFEKAREMVKPKNYLNLDQYTK